MRDAFRTLSSRRLLLFGGKGGVGKTTVSSAVALHFAASRQVILFTTDPASNLRDLFPDGDPANLHIEQLDTNQLWRTFLDSNLEQFLEIGDRGTYLDREELRRFFELSLPGADELMAWMRIGEIAEENPDAMIVVDTAPTGHALRMLGAAEHFQQIAAALDAMEEKHRSMVRQFMRRDVRDAVDAFIEDFDARARSRRALLRDPKQTAFVPVMLSEPWVVEQTLRLIAEVREEGLDVPMAILNRAILEPDCPKCEARRKADESARASLAPLPVFDFPRSCIPLDTESALRSAFSPARAVEKVAEGRMRGQSSLKIPPTARMLFLAGKGGVGKTTCAASIALQLARRQPDEKFTIISVDPAHALRDVFASEKPPANLAVEMIDTRAKWRRFRETLGVEIEKAIDAITPSGMSVAYDTEALQKLIEVAPPGADELFAVNRLAALAADETIERVIVDTAPTGHFLRLMDLPKSAGEWVREFMRILLRYRDLIPPGSLGSELVSASRSLTALDEVLRSERAATFVVTRPERVVIAETKRLIRSLSERGIGTAGVIANYVTPQSECACERSMRGYELEALREIDSEPLVIERRDEPVTSLDELARLFDIASDSAPE
ncbi:MAG TPA: ArsA family ATPase [Thermoanaerobaculia bacterium]|nr:ArsA family ATPase [Thermoanaerobaculia bacterium]